MQLRPRQTVFRAEAKVAGAPRYFTGKACSHGHVAERLTSNGMCTTCMDAFNAQQKVALGFRRAYVPERAKAAQFRYYRAHGDQMRAMAKAKRIASPGHTSAASLKHRRKNPEKWRAYGREYYRRNRGIYIALAGKRRARLLMAIPAWADLGAIKAIYKACTQIKSITGISHEVDHIIPLQGKDVCGLHVAWNLQILTKVENRLKSNKWSDGHAA